MRNPTSGLWSALSSSVALSVNNCSTVLLVIGSSDPGGGEGGEGGESGTTSPHGELSVWLGNNLDLGTSGGLGGNFSLKSLGKVFVHGGTTGKNKVSKKGLSDIDIGLVDGVHGELVEGLAALTIERRLEEELGAAHTDLSLDGDDALIGESVGHILGGGALSSSFLFLEVLSDVASLLLDVLDDFELGGGGEVVAVVEEELLAPVGEHATGDVHLGDGVGDGETFEDGHSVGNTITGVNNETSGSTVGVEGEDSLDLDVGVGHAEGLEHDGDHALSVGLGVHGSLSEEDTLGLGGGNSELVVEGVLPDLLHVVPVGDNTGGNGVLEVQDTSLLLSLVTDVLRLDLDTLHGAGVSGSTDNGGEHSGGSILTSDTGLDHTGSVIDHNNGEIFCHSLCFFSF